MSKKSWILWVVIAVVSVFFIIVLGLVSSTLYFWFRLRRYTQVNNKQFDIRQLVETCGNGCIYRKDNPNVKIYIKIESDRVTFSSKSVKWIIYPSSLSHSETDIPKSSTFSFLGSTFGAYLSPCRNNTICILNLSQPSIQRFCLDYSTYDIFISGPLNTPSLNIRS
jgi:hypothetical protein